MARCSDVTYGPRRSSYFGTPIVLWRDRGNLVSALIDACPHKGASLSLGRLDGDFIVCPYHGMRFKPCHSEGAGSLHAIHLQTRELYGLVWVCPAEDNRHGAILTMDFHCSNNASYAFSDEVRSSFLNVIDNLFDTSHFAEVHRATFAGKAEHPPKITDYFETSTGFRFQYVAPITSSAEFADFVGADANLASVNCEYIAPFSQFFTVNYNNGIKYSSVQTLSPHTPSSCLLFQSGFLSESSLDIADFFHAADIAIWKEDKLVLESLQKDVVVDYVGAAVSAPDEHTRYLVDALSRYLSLRRFVPSS